MKILLKETFRSRKSVIVSAPAPAKKGGSGSATLPPTLLDSVNSITDHRYCLFLMVIRIIMKVNTFSKGHQCTFIEHGQIV